VLVAIVCALVFSIASAHAADLAPLVEALGKGGFSDTEKAVQALAATGDPAVAPVLEALGEGDLYLRKSDGKVVIGKKQAHWRSASRSAARRWARPRAASSRRSRSTTSCGARSAPRSARSR
jgi:urea transport system permease protein